ncbi:hypothetical protein QIA45_05280 (plasmid) [Borreliella andersonii]|uniref:Uncharacterized protein n=1 Tax=Borrelia andersonii TaxID=42109 RepID=A0ACD5G8L3_BORAD
MAFSNFSVSSVDNSADFNPRFLFFLKALIVFCYILVEGVIAIEKVKEMGFVVVYRNMLNV